MSAVRVAFAQAVLAAAVIATTGAVDAAASDAVRPAPGAPDPRLMVLTAADLGGAKVVAQRYYKDKEFPSVISYERELEDARSGSTVLPYVGTEAEVGKSVGTTTSFLASFRAFLGTRQGRQILTQSIAEGAGGEGLVSNIQVGRPRNLGVGPGSFVLPISARILGARTEFPLALFRVERVLGVLSAFGVPGRRVPLATLTRLARIMAGRMTAALAPQVTTPPAVAGTAAVGQTLTASTGTWSGKPTRFAYQWQRCDAAGSACVPIGGAASATYVVAEADVGRTLRVLVTASNSVGAATAASARTTVVEAPGAPTNSAPPVISGLAQVGQTLSASTGTWNGNPTAFGFQWQRCDASGASCADISGAASGTYVLTASDAGFTVRVVVTATNASGSGTATSAPTAVVT